MQLPNHIDLHGLTVQKGYNKTLMFIKMSFLNHKSACKIITGRSGQMNREFRGWCNSKIFNTYVEEVYQDFHKGSWTVRLKKR